jgi:hypothetical protein
MNKREFAVVAAMWTVVGILAAATAVAVVMMVAEQAETLRLAAELVI